MVEEKDGESAVEEALVDVGHEMACCLQLVFISHNAPGAKNGFCRNVQAFLLALPIGISFSSRTMQTSSINLICSSSYPARSSSLPLGRAAPIMVVLTSGNRRRTFSAVMVVIGCVMVVVVLILDCDLEVV